MACGRRKKRASVDSRISAWKSAFITTSYRPLANNVRYEKYERVDMGDFNWVTPDFLAFASPQHRPTHVIPASSPMYSTLPTNIAEVQRSGLPTPFKNVLSHFSARNIGLVVRLNSELYSSSYFTALGIQHLNMIFD